MLRVLGNARYCRDKVPRVLGYTQYFRGQKTARILGFNRHFLFSRFNTPGTRLCAVLSKFDIARTANQTGYWYCPRTQAAYTCTLLPSMHILTRYGGPTTACPSDASVDGNITSKTAPYPTPTRLSRQVPKAVRRQRTGGGYYSRVSRHVWERSACRGR